MNILISGATGNVGLEVCRLLQEGNPEHQIFAGVRNPEQEGDFHRRFPAIHLRKLDFNQPERFPEALVDIQVVFLLRPPQLSDVKKYFEPLVATCVQAKVMHLLFLSVQGAEKSSLIPHHKIEKRIVASGIPYTFLRPAYFMQNFTTTLASDIRKRSRVYLPAGKARFTLIDIRDLAAVAAEVLLHPDAHRKKAYDLTNSEPLDFKAMCDLLSKGLGRKIAFVSPNLLQFYVQKRKEGMPAPYILVMILLHYLPRFQPTPQTSDWVEELLGRKAIGFEEFVQREKQKLQQQ
ncbi:NmrA family NAD(P)-binding protein [Cyclobacterium xiamenense]|uniref:NmrA family NAD(P)-binding protein n=1 Tax=Cyclobacterium xiamenense TaxID=1297121 RepID=UPI0012B82326|nr:NmrA family NAD(P)-binding protein [Cyclobacterium xiamenense]